MKPHRSRRAAAGFTLIELLITLVIVSVGMLGLAKLEAAAVAESQVARIRSLMTFQAESLTAMMQANRAYWGSTTGAAPGFTMPIGATVPVDSAAATNKMVYVAPGGAGISGCIGSSLSLNVCSTPAKLAYDDIFNTWAPAFLKQFPNGGATVACTVTANLPTTCDISMSWTEHYVTVNRNANAAPLAPTVNMVLHVQP